MDNAQSRALEGCEGTVKGALAGSYMRRRPIDGVDDSGASYEVNIDKGWVNVIQEDTYGKDVLSAMDPDDALWLAERLVEAATEAKRHPRWREG